MTMTDRETSGDTILATYGDLVLVALVTLSALVLATTDPAGEVGSYLQVVLGFLFVFFLPGYALTAALFPVAAQGHGGRGDGLLGNPHSRALSWVERGVVSVGLSVIVVPISVVVWNFSPWGIALPQVLGGVGALTGVALVVAAIRRRRLPPFLRFQVTGLGSNVARVSAWVGQGGALNAVLLVLVVLSAGGFGVHLATAENQERYTEFSLLSASPNGTLVADDYPTEFTAGEPQTLHVGVTNHERQTVSYTVVVKLQTVEIVDERRTITRERELDRFSTTLDHTESVQRPHQVAPVTVGSDLRLTYLLYRGDPPAEPTVDNAYRTVYHWIEVSAGTARQGGNTSG
jgi:uncharacterized membrane protein